MENPRTLSYPCVGKRKAAAAEYNPKHRRMVQRAITLPDHAEFGWVACGSGALLDAMSFISSLLPRLPSRSPLPRGACLTLGTYLCVVIVYLRIVYPGRLPVRGFSINLSAQHCVRTR